MRSSGLPHLLSEDIIEHVIWIHGVGEAFLEADHFLPAPLARVLGEPKQRQGSLAQNVKILRCMAQARTAGYPREELHRDSNADDFYRPAPADAFVKPLCAHPCDRQDLI